jgi:hypothetical protein
VGRLTAKRRGYAVGTWEGDDRPRRSLQNEHCSRQVGDVILWNGLGKDRVAVRDRLIGSGNGDRNHRSLREWERLKESSVLAVRQNGQAIDC